MRSWVARQDNIPRGRTIPMGAVPAEARGLRHTAPTYLRRRPGSPSNDRLGSALYAYSDRREALDLDQRRSEESSAPRGPRPATGDRPRRPRSFQPPSRRRGTAPRPNLAPNDRFGISPAGRRAGHGSAFDGARRGGIR